MINSIGNNCKTSKSSSWVLCPEDFHLQFGDGCNPRAGAHFNHVSSGSTTPADGLRQDYYQGRILETSPSSFNIRHSLYEEDLNLQHNRNQTHRRQTSYCDYLQTHYEKLNKILDATASVESQSLRSNKIDYLMSCYADEVKFHGDNLPMNFDGMNEIEALALLKPTYRYSTFYNDQFQTATARLYQQVQKPAIENFLVSELEATNRRLELIQHKLETINNIHPYRKRGYDELRKSEGSILFEPTHKSNVLFDRMRCPTTSASYEQVRQPKMENILRYQLAKRNALHTNDIRSSNSKNGLAASPPPEPPNGAIKRTDHAQRRFDSVNLQGPDSVTSHDCVTVSTHDSIASKDSVESQNSTESKKQRRKSTISENILICNVGTKKRKPPIKNHKNKGKPGRPKKVEGWPKRPLSAYNVFFKTERQNLLNKNETNLSDLAKKVALKWRRLSPEEKNAFEIEAKKCKDNYEKEVNDFLWSESKKCKASSPP